MKYVTTLLALSIALALSSIVEAEELKANNNAEIAIAN